MIISKPVLGERQRQRDRQPYSQTDRKTHRERQRQTERDRDIKETDRNRDRQRESHLSAYNRQGYLLSNVIFGHSCVFQIGAAVSSLQEVRK